VITRVGDTGKFRSGGATSCAGTFGVAPVAGDLVVVSFCGTESHGALAPHWRPHDCTDNQGNTYALAFSSVGNTGSYQSAVWWTITGAVSGSFTVTVNPTRVGTFYGAGAATAYRSDYGPGWTLGGRSYTTGSSTTPATGNTGTLASGEHVAIATVWVASTVASIAVDSVSPSWQQDAEELDGSTYVAGESNSRIVSGASAQSCGWTLGSSLAWGASVVVFDEVTADNDVTTIAASQTTGKFRVSGGASSAGSFGTAPQAGDLIVVRFWGYPGPLWAPNHCTDNQGNTYSLAQVTPDTVFNGVNVAVWYAVSRATSGTVTVTVATGAVGGMSYGAGCATSYTGSDVWRFDEAAQATGSSAAPATGSTGTLVDATSVSIATLGTSGTDQASITVETVSPAWTQDAEELSWASYIPGETDSRVLASTAAQSCSWTLSTSTPWACGVVTFALVVIVTPAAPPPSGGGTTAGGTNPAAGTLPTTLPLKFAQLRTHDGTSSYFAETLLSDNATWTEAPGKKAGKLVGVSRIRRELSNRGAFVTTRFTVTLADTDRQFRVLSDTQMIRGAYLAVYVVDDATRRAEGVPTRIMAGVVTSHRALPGFRYELEAEDVLGHKLSEYNKQPTLPPDRFSLADFPGLDPALEGRSIPIAMGALVDDVSETYPQGVVPALFVGYLNLLTIGGIDAVVDAYVFSQAAVSSVYNLYFNPLTWDESTAVEVGDVVRPTPDNASGYIYRATVAGTTGTTEPTWPTGVASTVTDGGATWQRGEADDQNFRLLVPDSAYGTVLVTPGKPGWTAATGQAANYVDYNGRRYTPLFILRSHRYAEAVRDGRIMVTANLYGVAENSDGSGLYIDDPPRMWEWLLTNYVLGRYTTGAYITPATLDGTYAAIDHDSVEAAVTAHDARLAGGYVGALLLGADGEPSTVFDALQRICEGGDFDQGINRHGQLMVSVEDVAAAPVITFNSQADVEDGRYESWIESSDYANQQEHFYGRRYIQTRAIATPKQGDPLPRREQRYGEWRSGLVLNQDTVAIANAGERVIYTLENHILRDTDVAGNMGETHFLRNLGPLREGPRMVRFTTGWQGLGTGATYVDLGSVIGVTHPERVGTSATATDTCRVLAIDVDPLRDRVTLECRVLASIADANEFQQWAPVTMNDGGGDGDTTTNDGVSGQSLA
jgi:hypothetical protein